MNKKNYEYIVLFGNDKYNPDLCYRACRDRFDYLKDARAFASQFSNASVFKVQFNHDSPDPVYFVEIYYWLNQRRTSK